jgi:uncharacterized protein (TIRG00374 family)
VSDIADPKDLSPAEDADPELPDVPEPIGPTNDCGRPVRRARRAFRTVLPMAIGAALIGVAVASGSSVSAAFRAIDQMDRTWLIWGLGAEVLSYVWLSLHLRLLAGHPSNARRAAPLRLALVVFGLGNVLPAAPAEGLVMADAALKRRRLDPRRIAVLLGFSQWFSTRALFAVAAIDALVAVTVGDIPHPYRGGLIAGTMVTLVLLGLTGWLSLRRGLAEWVATVLLRVRYWRNCPSLADRRARGTAWHRVAVHVTGNRRRRALLLTTTGAAWVSDGLCMYFALRAAGVRLSLDQLLLAYTAGVIASNVPLIPAGLGIVETVTPLILVHYGVPWTNAIAVVLVYRLMGTLLPALAGAFAVINLRLGPEGVSEADVQRFPTPSLSGSDKAGPTSPRLTCGPDRCGAGS